MIRRDQLKSQNTKYLNTQYCNTYLCRMFTDRVDELSYLEGRHSSGRAELVVISGRRRVGKTCLAKKFTEGKRSIYFLAQKEPMQFELERLKRAVSRSLGIYADAGDWDSLFQLLAKESSERLVLVIDEFNYWVEEDPNVFSMLQRLWDEHLAGSKIMLILSGSAFSTMARSLSQGNPLYGRRTGKVALGPLPPWCIRDFLPSYSREDAVRVFAALGSTPYHLSQLEGGAGFEANIDSAVLSKRGLLYEDAEVTLTYEFREPSSYLNILRAIAGGATGFSEVSSKSGVDITNLAKYLRTLEGMGIVRRETTVLGKERPLYVMADQYFKFWARYVYPNRDFIELGNFSFGDVRDDFERSFLPRAFEELARQSVPRLQREGALPAGRSGRWWQKGSEIDIVVASSPPVLLEVKWRDMSRQEALDVAASARAKWQGESRCGVVARSLEDKASLRERFCAFDLEDLLP